MALASGGGCRTNQTACTNLTTPVFADLVRAAQAAREGPSRPKWFTPKPSPCGKPTRSRARRWFVRQPRRFAGLAVGRRADLLSAARGAHDAGESRVPSQVPAAPPAVTSTRSQSQKGSSRRVTARALPLVVRSDSLTLGSQHARTAACRASSYACSAVSGELRPRWWPVIGLCRTHHRPRSSA